MPFPSRRVEYVSPIILLFTTELVAVAPSRSAEEVDCTASMRDYTADLRTT
jgi:hypothetical protein